MVTQVALPSQERQIARWAISVADYHRMHDAGILGEDDRVELIDGEVRYVGQRVRRKFSVADYHRMHDAGILGEDDRVELIDGEVRQMSPIGIFHAAIVTRYDALLHTQISKSAIVSVQNPIRLNDGTEPQPDLALLRYRADFYAKAAPTAADVLLLIEVSDSTLADDRLEKLPRYALAGIPEVWLTDVAGEAVERYTEPHDDQYETKQTFKRGQQISVQALPAITLNIGDIFGEIENEQ